MKIICITGKRGCGDAMSEFTEKSTIPFEFYSVPANYEKPAHHGIKLAHQFALDTARRLSLDSSIIVEDDVELTSRNSIEYFMDCRYLAKELDYDIIVGGAHHYEKSEFGANKLSGFHFYSVLNPDVSFEACPKGEHIDNWVGRNYKVWVCEPMIAVQRPGYSERVGKDVDYSERFKRYSILR
jgi:hypothetical protein